jgi:hypothetical protein
MTDLHPWQEATSPLTAKLKQPIDSSIVLRIPGTVEEVIRLDKDGFHYRGQFIEDAGEARRLMVEFLRQSISPVLAEQPVGPTDDQIDELWDKEAGYYELYGEVRNVVRAALRLKGAGVGKLPNQQQQINDFLKAFFNAYSAYGWVSADEFNCLFEEAARLAGIVEEGWDASVNPDDTKDKARAVLARWGSHD